MFYWAFTTLLFTLVLLSLLLLVCLNYESFCVFNSRYRPRKPKVANFHCAVLVDQYVRRLYVSVQDASRVHVLQSAEQIVHDGLDMLVGKKDRCLEQLFQVRLSGLKDQIQGLEAYWVCGLK